MPHPPISYLALGDSYTIGESVPEHESFPFQTVELLREKGWEISNPEIIATTGWTTTQLLDALQKHPPRKKSFEMLTLLIGVNNQYQKIDAEVYKKDLKKLLEVSIDFAGGIPNHVWVMSIPDYSITPFAEKLNRDKINEEINIYNRINNAISQKFKTNYLNITPLSLQAASDHTLTASDGLHPSGKQYGMWGEELARDVLKKWRHS